MKPGFIFHFGEMETLEFGHPTGYQLITMVTNVGKTATKPSYCLYNKNILTGRWITKGAASDSEELMLPTTSDKLFKTTIVKNTCLIVYQLLDSVGK